MAKILVYTAGSGEASAFAARYLKRTGIALVEHPMPEITHLLLDVPCREVPNGLLERLPEDICVVGGNLNRPELDGYAKLDLLTRENYLAQNAAITADCAVRVAAARMKTVFSGSSVLVIGWGRIGKCLAALLQSIGCHVTVAARKRADQAMLNALGYDTADPGSIRNLQRYDIIFNTAPTLILDKAALSLCPDTLKIDLASCPGLDGPDVIWARGLPGLYAPESSGRLIAETFMKEVTT